MKTITISIIILTLFMTISAQKKMSDKEFNGYKGNVKSVSIEYMPVSRSNGVKDKDERAVWGIKYFDKEGRQTEEHYPDTKYKLMFAVIDGFKTFKSIEEENSDKDYDTDSFDPIDKPKPIEKPEKIVKPDEQFDFKFIYQYDAQGRVITERQYENNGKLWKLRTFEYNDKGQVSQEIINDTVAITKNTYKYDDNGYSIEEISDRNIKGPGQDIVSRKVYSDYKTDKQGNWTERKSTLYFNIKEKNNSYISMDYQVITYY